MPDQHLDRPINEKEPTNKVFVISLLLCIVIGFWAVISPTAMTIAALDFTNYVLGGISWFWLGLCTLFLLLSIYLIFGPYGHIRLGRDDELPEFSTVSWITMLFACGMGAGLLFWGVAEPLYHFAAPPGMEGGNSLAAREAMVITNLHWGLHAWAIYGVCALAIAYFCYRKGQRAMVSTPIVSLFKGRLAHQMTIFADILCVLAVVFGIAGTLTMGTLQLKSGLIEIFHMDPSDKLSFLILGTLFLCYLLSAASGVNKGIRVLSNINVSLCILILLVILFSGPTKFILEIFINSLGDYFSRIVEISFRLFPYEGLTKWSSGWTLTYLIWWLAWGPFVGMFIARISRGRTIKEFCIGVILVPTLFSILWFSTFGGTGIYIELFAGGGLVDLVFEDVTSTLFAFFSYFPFPYLLSVCALLLVSIFLVTTADSATFVVSMMTTDGDLNPPLVHKMIWAIVIALITAALLLADSAITAKAMAIFGAIPFSVILIFQLVGFMREIRNEVITDKSSSNDPTALPQISHIK